MFKRTLGQLTVCTAAASLVVGLASVPAPVVAEDTWQDFTATFFPPPPPAEIRADTLGAGAAPAVMSDGWDGDFLRVTHAENSQNNTISFEQLYSGEYEELSIEFEFRIDNGPGGADGLGIAYLNSATYGTDTSAPNPSLQEEPNLVGSFGVGFDTFNNGGGPDADIPGGDASTPNSVSLHWDGAKVANFDLSPTAIPLIEFDLFATPDALITASILVVPNVTGSEVTVTLDDGKNEVLVYDAFQIDGFFPYDGRLAIGGRTGGANQNQDVDNVRVAVTPDGLPEEEILFEDFEGAADIINPPEGEVDPPELAGGSLFSFYNVTGGNPGPSIEPEAAEPGFDGEEPGFLRAAAEVGSQSGGAIFDLTCPDTDLITLTVKYRGLDGGLLGRADGAAIMLADTDLYGETGADLFLPPNAVEEPNLTGVFGVGFDTFNNNDGVNDPVEDLTPVNVGNHLSLHWNGAKVTDAILPLEEMDLVNNEWNDVTISLEDVGDGYIVTVVIVDGTDDSEHVVFDEVFIEGMAFVGGARPALGARTGGAADNYDYDDLHVVYGEIDPPDGVGPFVRGDCNGDGAVVGQVTDAAFLFAYNFTGGAVPPCFAACDANMDGAFVGAVTDGVYILQFNFLGGAAPPAPFPECGSSDAASDVALGCETPTCEI